MTLYLTENEYALMPFPKVNGEDFFRLVTIAGDLLDTVTRYFYVSHDLEADNNIFRKNQFKKAVGAQIGYMAEAGASTSEGMQRPQSVTIGRTSLSDSSRYNVAGKNEQKSLLSDDAVRYLHGTGLLYRGSRLC